MYVKDDPRSSLQPAGAASQVHHDEFFGVQLALFYDTAPQIEAEGEKTWIARGQNFIVVYSECEMGSRLIRDDQPDEYALIVPDTGTTVTISAGSETVEVPGYSLAFVPRGGARSR